MESQKKETLDRLEKLGAQIQNQVAQFESDYRNLVGLRHGDAAIGAGGIAQGIARLMQALVGLEAARVGVEMTDIVREASNAVQDEARRLDS